MIIKKLKDHRDGITREKDRVRFRGVCTTYNDS
jgi:hypothetical protein